MAIVIYLFYPVDAPAFPAILHSMSLIFLQESAGKTLEEMDFLFAKDRTPWVFTDKQATKIGAIFDRDFERGEAFTAFDDKDVDGVDHLERVGGDSPAVNRGEVENKI